MRQKNLKRRIEEHFYYKPTSRLRVRQIERELSIPLPSARRYVNELVEEGFLKRVSVANIVTYTADRSSTNFLRKKQLFNVEQIYASGLIEYLQEILHNPTITLFGSYSRGEDTEDSDIDLYVQTPAEKQISLSKYEKMLGRPIQLFIHKSINDVNNPELANNILNGITLNGFLEVF